MKAQDLNQETFLCYGYTIREAVPSGDVFSLAITTATAPALQN